MEGIYWCPKCAKEKREERAWAFYNSPEEKARRAAVGAAKRPIDETYKGSLRMREPYKPGSKPSVIDEPGKGSLRMREPYK